MESPAHDHFEFLKQMYEQHAAINSVILHKISVSQGEATVDWEVDPKFFHAGASLHGSIYFKMLDDAAFFAASSLEREFFMLTATFQVQFFRPVTGGTLQAQGRVTVPGRQLVHASSELRDMKGKLVAAGQGTFMRSQLRLEETGTGRA